MPPPGGSRGTVAGTEASPGRRVRDSSSFLGTQKWRVKEGLQNWAFCSRCCQGGGKWEGVLRPRRGQCGRWTVDETEREATGYKGHRVGPGNLGDRGKGSGDSSQDTIC